MAGQNLTHARQNSIITGQNSTLAGQNPTLTGQTTTVRSSPMGQSSSPRSHSSSSQSGISPTDTAPPSKSIHFQDRTTYIPNSMHSYSNSLDNTRSSNDSRNSGNNIGGGVVDAGGHVNLAFQGTEVVNSNNAVHESIIRHPDDQFRQQRSGSNRNSGSNYLEHRPKTPTGSEQRPQNYEQIPKTPIVSTYEQQSRPKTPVANVGHMEQRPKTPMANSGHVEQRPKTPVANDGHLEQRPKTPIGQQSNSHKLQTGMHQSKPFADANVNKEFLPKTPVSHGQQHSSDFHLNHNTHRSSTPGPISNSQTGHNVSDLNSWQGNFVSVNHGRSNSGSNQQSNSEHSGLRNYENTFHRDSHTVQSHQSKSFQGVSHPVESYPMQQLSRNSPTKQLQGPHNTSNVQKNSTQFGQVPNSLKPHAKKTVSIQLPPTDSTDGGPTFTSNKSDIHNTAKSQFSDSDGSITPPLPPLSPDNTPPYTPPDSPSTKRHTEQHSHSGQYHHTTSKLKQSNEHSAELSGSPKITKQTAIGHLKSGDIPKTSDVHQKKVTPANVRGRPPVHNGGRRAERKGGQGPGGVRTYGSRLKKSTVTGRGTHRLGSGSFVHHQRMLRGMVLHVIL